MSNAKRDENSYSEFSEQFFSAIFPRITRKLQPYMVVYTYTIVRTYVYITYGFLRIRVFNLLIL